MSKKSKHDLSVSFTKSKKEGFVEKSVGRWLDESFGSRGRRSRQMYSWQDRMKQEDRRKITGHAKRLHVRYGNLVLIVLGLVGAILIAQNSSVLDFMAENIVVSLISSVVMGMMYSFGITTPACVTGFVILGRTMDPLVLALLGAAGTVISNFLVYKLIRHRIEDYMHGVASRYMKVNIHIIRIKVNKHPVMKHLIPVFAGFLLASPLPSEIAIGIFASVKFDMGKFLAYTFIFNLFSLYLITSLGVGL